jgi:hypothetical protein
MQIMCDCIEKANAHLAQHNTKIMFPMIGPQLPFVETIKIDSKKRGLPVKMFASYCPFCGDKLDSTSDLEAAE